MITRAKLVAEFTGTFLLMVAIGGNTILQNGLWGIISIASILMVSIYTFGVISGANFNPAISFSLGILRHVGGKGMIWREVCYYIITQLFAGVCGGLFYYYMFEKAFTLSSARNTVSLGICEVTYTFMICFINLNVGVAKDKAPNEYYGLAIALVPIAACCGAVTGGDLLNPAIALGVDISTAILSRSFEYFGNSFVHIGFELIGALLAVVVFKLVRPGDFDVEKFGVTLNSKLLSECVGSFLIVFTYGMSVLGSSPATPLSVAAVITSMLYSLSDISGGHFNPAVTLSLFCSKMYPMSPKTMGYYMLAQAVGGIAAVVSYGHIYHDAYFDHVRLLPGPRLKVALAEILFTLVICLAMLTATLEERTKLNGMYGVVVGACIAAGGFLTEHISGGLFNPATVIGVAAHGFVKDTLAGKDFIYIVYQLVGGVLAASLLKVTHQRSLESDEQCKQTSPRR